MTLAAGLRILFFMAIAIGLEAICRFGVVSSQVLLPPSAMASSLYEILKSGRFNADIGGTLRSVAIAGLLATCGGVLIGAIIHSIPRLRRALDPMLSSYYALPFFAFYPVLIVFFGIGEAPIIAMGAFFGVVAMILATFNGLDRIPHSHLKTARILKLGRIGTLFRVKLPGAMPSLFGGAKLAVTYSFIAVIASEFIIASAGLGYQIGYAFNNFDNKNMYGLMLLVLILAVTLNLSLQSLERRTLRYRRAER